MKLKVVAPLAMVSSVAAVLAFVSALAYQDAGDTVDWAKGKQLASISTMIEVFIREQTLHTTEAAELLGSNPQVGEMVAKNDHDGLIKMLMPGYRKAATKYGVDALGIVSPPATTVARLHNPAKFGDDQSAYRPLLVFTNQTREVQSGLEIASVAGVRGVVPVYNGTTHVGALEIATGLGEAGAQLAITSRKIDKAREAAERYQQALHVEVLPLAMDLLDEASVMAAFAEVKVHYGRLDILVNNAGGHSPLATGARGQLGGNLPACSAVLVSRVRPFRRPGQVS